MINKIVIDTIHKLQDEDVLSEILNMKEGPTLEFRSSIPSIEIICKILSAFVNAKGGLILFGIDDRGTVIGIDDPDSFNMKIMESLKHLQPTPESTSSGIVHYNDKALGAVIIWPLGEEYKPISYNGKYYKRIGNENIILNEKEIRSNFDYRKEPKKLFLTTSDFETFFNVADEDTFTTFLVVPFLRHIGFQCVLPKLHKDKSLEFGQDLRIFKYRLPTGHYLYFSAQIKTGEIKYTQNDPEHNISMILTQLEMAFKKQIFDIETNSFFLPDHVFLISSGFINDGARQFLSEHLASKKRRKILFWDTQYLIEKLEEFELPEATQVEIKKYIDEKVKK